MELMSVTQLAESSSIRKTTYSFSISSIALQHVVTQNYRLFHKFKGALTIDRALQVHSVIAQNLEVTANGKGTGRNVPEFISSRKIDLYLYNTSQYVPYYENMSFIK